MPNTKALNIFKVTAGLLFCAMFIACQPAKMRSITDGQGASDSEEEGEVLNDDLSNLGSLEIIPGSAELPVGKKQKFILLGYTADKKSSKDLTDKAQWTVSDGTVAAIDTDGPSVILAKEKGELDVIASIDKNSIKAPVVVIDAEMMSLKVQPNELVLGIGSSGNFKAIGTYSDGSTKDVTEAAIWESKDGLTASVNSTDAKGAVLGVKIGSTTVNASLGQYEDSGKVTVVASKLVSLAIQPSRVIIPKGVVALYRAYGTYSDSKIIDVTDQVSWSVMDESVGERLTAAGDQGKFRGLSVGTTKVSASDGAISADATLVVTEAQMVAMEVLPSTGSVAVGGTKTYQSFAVFTDGSKRDVSNDADWRTANTGVATVGNTAGSKGIARGVDLGETDVIASWSAIQGSAKVQVVEPPVPLVEIKADNKLGSLSVATNKVVVVNWTSSNAVSCQVKMNASTFDNRLIASVNYKVASTSEFVATCVNATGKSARSSVKINVTLPNATLLVDGKTVDFSIPANAPVTTSWSSTDASVCVLKKNGATIATKLSGSMTADVVDTALFELLCNDTENNTVTKTVRVSANSVARLLVDAGAAEQIPGTAVARKLSIYFALDVTSSMKVVTNTIKDNIVSFVDQLKAKNFEPRLGAIPFRDDLDLVEGRLPLTSDIAKFKTFVGNLNGYGGGDDFEASLLGVEASLSDLLIQEKNTDAMQVILVITDNPGHRGTYITGYTRDCAVETTASRFNAVAADRQKLVKLFYSAPNTGYNCSGFTSAIQQFEALIDKALPAVEKANRGGKIAWPFNSDGLVNRFSELISSLTPPIDLVCLDQKAELFIDNTSSLKWNAPSLSSVYANYKAGKKIALEKVFQGTELVALGQNRGRLNMERCCVSKTAADAGNFGTCVKRMVNTNAPFTLEK